MKQKAPILAIATPLPGGVDDPLPGLFLFRHASRKSGLQIFGGAACQPRLGAALKY